MVEADHKPFDAVVTENLANIRADLQRTMLQMLGCDFQLRYKPGQEMLLPDAISRYNADLGSKLPFCVVVCLLRCQMKWGNFNTREPQAYRRRLWWKLTKRMAQRHAQCPETSSSVLSKSCTLECRMWADLERSRAGHTTQTAWKPCQAVT